MHAIDLEVLADVRHAATHGIALAGVGDRFDNDVIAGLKVVHILTELNNLADHLVTHDSRILDERILALHDVHIRTTYTHGMNLDEHFVLGLDLGHRTLFDA